MTVWKVIVHYAFLTVHCHRFAMTSPSFLIKVINLYKKTEKNAFQHSLCHQFHSVAFQLFSSFSISNLNHPVTSSTMYSITYHTRTQCIIRSFFKCSQKRSVSLRTLLSIPFAHYIPITFPLHNLLQKCEIIGNRWKPFLFVCKSRQNASSIPPFFGSHESHNNGF